MAEEGIQLERMGIAEAAAYQAWLLEASGMSRRTITGYLHAAALFYDYLQRAELAIGNPFRAIRLVKEEKVLPRNILKEEEMERLLSELAQCAARDALRPAELLAASDAPPREAKSAYRLHVLAELLYASGLRIAEAAGLTPDDIDLRRAVVTVREGKGGRSRVAYLNDYAKEVLRVYLEHWEALYGRTGLLFGVKRLTEQTNEQLAAACERLGLPRVTNHGFRHALGYHLLRSGCPLRYIQEILGHRSIGDTELYAKVDKESLRKVVDACHPRP
jgi:integrase/recombinase XerC